MSSAHCAVLASAGTHRAIRQFFAGNILGKSYIERAAIRAGADIRRLNIGLRVEAVGKDNPVGQFGNHGLHCGVVGAKNSKTIERYILDEIDGMRP